MRSMLFSRNRGNVVLPVSCDGAAASGITPSFFVSSARDSETGEIIIKAVNASQEPAEAAIDLEGVTSVTPNAQAIVLSGKKRDDQNAFDDPTKVSPKTSPIENAAPQFSYSFAPYSLTVLRIRAAAN